MCFVSETGNNSVCEAKQQVKDDSGRSSGGEEGFGVFTYNIGMYMYLFPRLVARLLRLVFHSRGARYCATVLDFIRVLSLVTSFENLST